MPFAVILNSRQSPIAPLSRFAALLFTIGGCVLFTSPAQAAPDRLALVIGESAYSQQAPLRGCLASADSVSQRLRALGFDVIATTDSGSGATDAALIDFAQRVTAASNPATVVYFCGQAVGYGTRLFLLPVETQIDRPSDALTRGVLAQSVIDMAARHARVAMTVLDIFNLQQGQSDVAETASALNALMSGQASINRVVIAAIEAAGAPATATPLARSLANRLEKPPVPIDALAEGIRQDLAGNGVSVAVAGTGGGMALVPPPPPVAAPPAAPATPQPNPPAPPAPLAALPQHPETPASPPPPAVSGQPPGLSHRPSPAQENAATEPEKRTARKTPPVANAPVAAAAPEARGPVMERLRVQAALQKFGYYDGPVDGVFGPRTRVAISRLQDDRGEPATGELTPQQQAALLNGEPFAIEKAPAQPASTDSN